jgi:hypothetical protein
MFATLSSACNALPFAWQRRFPPTHTQGPRTRPSVENRCHVSGSRGTAGSRLAPRRAAAPTCRWLYSSQREFSKRKPWVSLVCVYWVILPQVSPIPLEDVLVNFFWKHTETPRNTQVFGNTHVIGRTDTFAIETPVLFPPSLF